MTQPPPPPSPGTAPGQPPPTAGGTMTFYTHQSTYHHAFLFRDIPITTQCQYCRAMITTSTRCESGAATWVACLVMFFTLWWLGCCFIPFCLDGCKDVVHSCPNCHQILGKYSRM